MQPILTVNLSNGEIGQYTIPIDWERDYIGGSALAARLLYDSLAPDLDPFSPQASLLWLNGPLSGTTGPAVGRFVICARSPATGLWGESNCGGFWGVELRKAGYDGLWLTGRAVQPVYLVINDRQVQIHPAQHLWGLDTYTTQKMVADELGIPGSSIAVIGPAGEMGIPYALILTDHGRVAGRTGMGAVMGSKNLKAVAVRGSGKVPVFDLDTYAPLRLAANRALRNDPVSLVGRELGTGGVADYFDYLGLMPKKYFQASHFRGAADISGATIKEKMLVGISACHGCVIACGRVVSLPEPDGKGDWVLRAGKKQKGPEYETLVGFGPNLLLNDPAFATRMSDLCDRYGIDTISTSNTIGLAFLLYEQGRITRADTSGLELEWGNAGAVEALVHQIGRKEWFGIRLAQGARALGKHYGAEAEAVQVNGLEVAYHDPRGGSGLALVYATSPRGACHNQSDFFFVEIGQVDPALGMEMHGRFEGAIKSPNVAHHQNWRTASNALVMCLFANVAPETIAALTSAATGIRYTVDDLLTCGERGFNLKRVINHRLGLKRENDSLPKAFRKPYFDSEDGFTPDFEPMLQAYYVVRGWDTLTGRPTIEKLDSLSLGWVNF